MGPFEQKLLLLLARYGQGIPRTGLRSLGAEYETAAKELVNRGYLVERPRGAYCYQIELLRLWVRQWERYDLEYQRLDVEMLKRILEVEVIVDLAKREVHIRGEVRPLSPQEYYLLELLCQRHDQLVTRKDLVSRLDSLYPGQTSSIDIVIHRLREKLGDRLIEDDAKKRHYLYIQNAPSQGYMISTERLMMRNGISDPLGDKK